MTFKRASPNMVFTFDDRRKFANFVSLFITINKQAKGKKSKGKNNGKTKRKYKDIGSWLHGPCFYLQLIYTKVINKYKIITYGVC